MLHIEKWLFYIFINNLVSIAVIWLEIGENDDNDVTKRTASKKFKNILLKQGKR